MKYVRKLELKCRDFTDGVKVDFEIVTQTQRNNLFTLDGGSFQASNGVRLVSAVFPCWFEKYDQLFVWGDDGSRDRETCSCAIKDWSKIKQAVKEYNEKFGEPTEVVDWDDETEETLKQDQEVKQTEENMKKNEVKQLEVTIELAPTSPNANAKAFVKKQTHFGKDFGKDGADYFVASNGLCLLSSCSGSNMSYPSCSEIVMMPATPELVQTTQLYFSVQSNSATKFLQAVYEYNEEFKEKPFEVPKSMTMTAARNCLSNLDGILAKVIQDAGDDAYLYDELPSDMELINEVPQTNNDIALLFLTFLRHMPESVFKGVEPRERAFVEVADEDRVEDESERYYEDNTERYDRRVNCKDFVNPPDRY